MGTLSWLIPLLILLPTAAAQNASSNTEAQALLTFKAAITDDPFSCLSSWSLHNATTTDDVHCFSWHGVGCDAHFRVISLDLSYCGLSGSISPSSLDLLTHLSHLDLSDNHLNGSIPPSLGLLTQLSHLDLSDNDFSGVLSPSLFPRPNSCLTHLDLSYNFDLSGEIPESLPLHSPNLRFLDLSRTNLSGVVPPALWTHLPLLGTLSIGWDGFTDVPRQTFIARPGSFPQSGTKFAFCATIEVLMLNDLNGSGASFPSSLGDCQRLRTLELSGHGWRGSIPSPIWQLPHLEELTIRDIRRALASTDGPYQLNWSWPSATFAFCNDPAASSITEIRISGIGLTGHIPASIATCAASLQILEIQDTNLEGPLPPSIGNLTQLRQLYLINNKLLTGEIPTTLGALTSLQWLDLSGNRLTGGIPPALGLLEILLILDLSQNNLTGILPIDLLLNLTELSTLRLSQNNLTGKINSLNLSMLPNLEVLDAYGNSFHGGLPVGLAEHQSLIFIDLQKNQLTGSLGPTTTTTSHITGLSYLRVLSVSYNQLNGDIPAWLWHLPRLQVLDLSNNYLTGHLPATLTHLSYFCMTNHTAASEEYGSSTLPYNLPVVNKNKEFVLSYVENACRVFDVSMNMLGGEIPKSFGELQGLTGVNLSHNQFNGTIHEGSFGRLKNLDVLDLSYNKLSGGIPQDLATLDISTLNLSSNHLEGHIPTENGCLC